MTWNLGYNVDLGYTYGYYREQDPAWLDLCALIRGMRPPSMLGAAQLRYLELGCGQGFNLCLLAASHPEMEFVGIDFNPQHIAHAQTLANTASLKNICFIEANFADLGQHWPIELGNFHYAAAHGILSWISKPVREGLYKCIKQSLAAGGLVYFSYNTLPGWLSTLPVQHLLRLWQVREELPSLQAIDLGRQRLSELIEAGVGMTQVLPAMKARLEKFGQLDKNYLVQEYLHDVWTNFWFDHLEGEVASYKLRFVGTASAGDWYLPAMLPEKGKAILAQFQDPIEREVMLDVLINQSFRRDLWARGHTPIWPAEQREALQHTRFTLIHRPKTNNDNKPPFTYPTSLGDVHGKPEVYGPLYDALESGSKSLAELVQIPAPNPRTIADTLQALGLMLHSGHVAIDNKVKDSKSAKLLNRTIAHAALSGAPYKHIVASAVPTAISCSDGDLMLLALWQMQPKIEAGDLAGQFVDRLVALGRGLKKDDQSLTTRETMSARALEMAENFLKQTLPSWRKLGIL